MPKCCPECKSEDLERDDKCIIVYEDLDTNDGRRFYCRSCGEVFIEIQ